MGCKEETRDRNEKHEDIEVMITVQPSKAKVSEVQVTHYERSVKLSS